MKETISRLKNKRVTVMGLGLFGGGVGITRWLYKQGARITVTDLRKSSELKESLKALSSIKNIKYHLGKHYINDFIKTDLLVVNPAVSKDSPYLIEAKKNLVHLETENNLFFQVCPCLIIGITGSNGKTTTVALLEKMLAGTGRKIWVGGNIGRQSLLERVHLIKKEDIVILELSSFQLEDLDLIKQSPDISVITNISPNHLDRHKTMHNYTKAKKSILRYQNYKSYAVLNNNDKEVRKWAKDCPGKILYFGNSKHSHDGACIIGHRFCTVRNNRYQPVCQTSETKLLGDFNLENVTAALAVASIFDVPGNHLKNVIRNFKGVEHRLEFVSEINGVKYYNDSIATNPNSTIGAIKAIAGNLHLILGGYDKQLPFDELAEQITHVHYRRIKSIILLGATAGKIEQSLLKSDLGCHLQNEIMLLKANDLSGAVLLAEKIARRHETVLFSPACASFDMFRNFAERGEFFKKAVTQLR
jgi:UDP-N-acetylmuramoylalanine--D-glutamate ligase